MATNLIQGTLISSSTETWSLNFSILQDSFLDFVFLLSYFWNYLFYCYYLRSFRNLKYIFNVCKSYNWNSNFRIHLRKIPKNILEIKASLFLFENFKIDKRNTIRLVLLLWHRESTDCHLQGCHQSDCRWPTSKTPT